MYEELFERISRASKSNSLSFFVGAGVSKLSNVPTWHELTDKFCDALGIEKKDNYTNEDYLKIPQKYYYSIHQDANKYYEFVSNALTPETELKTNCIHKMIYYLNPASIITTNFDNLLEKAAVESLCNYKSVACESDISGINGDKFILKLHGDLEHKNIVLKDEDYLNYSENYKLIETLLKSIFSTNTVVFVGYGLNDYNVKLILNWAKSLLKDSFNKPIFLYTDTDKLTFTDLLYEESRGLNVIQYQNCCSDQKDNYLDRYIAILDSIISYSNNTIKGKDKSELFDYLYRALKPLDELSALRAYDIRYALNNEYHIKNTGVFYDFDKTGIFDYFIDMNSQPGKLLTTDAETIYKYNTILSVFSKSRICFFDKREDDVKTLKDSQESFADKLCLYFDYKKMQKYVSRDYKDLNKLYVKAYYLAKLCMFNESFDIFKEVCMQAINEKKYTVYYFARVNLYLLSLTKRSLNRHLLYFNSYDTESLEQKMITNKRNMIFIEMPADFKNKYPSLESVSNSKLLYENFYSSYKLKEKIKSTIENSTIEFGETSLYSSFSAINENLHFYIGNHIYIDDFEEFRKSIIALMEEILFRYSVQNNHQIQSGMPFNSVNEEKVDFDNIDFYCIVEYFRDKELTNIINRYQIKTIEFNKMDLIEKSIENLIDYYAFLKSNNVADIRVINVETRIKTCLLLMQHMKISQRIINKLIRFLFKYNFREIDISDKIKFCDVQLNKNQMYSISIKRVLTTALCNYIDEHIACIETNTPFNHHSRSGLFYWDIALLFNGNKKGFISTNISKRVEYIIENNLVELYRELKNYYNIVTISAQKMILQLYLREMKKDPKFYYFEHMINNNVKISKDGLSKLKEIIDKDLKKDNQQIDGLKRYPEVDPYKTLREVAFWCMIGSLNSNDFKEYYGKDLYCDFFFDTENFDYSKFDVEWLYNATDYACKIISEKHATRISIKEKIKAYLLDNQLNEKDKNRYYELLVKYFC